MRRGVVGVLVEASGTAAEAGRNAGRCGRGGGRTRPARNGVSAVWDESPQMWCCRGISAGSSNHALETRRPSQDAMRSTERVGYVCASAPTITAARGHRPSGFHPNPNSGLDAVRLTEGNPPGLHPFERAARRSRFGVEDNGVAWPRRRRSRERRRPSTPILQSSRPERARARGGYPRKNAEYSITSMTTGAVGDRRGRTSVEGGAVRMGLHARRFLPGGHAAASGCVLSPHGQDPGGKGRTRQRWRPRRVARRRVHPRRGRQRRSEDTMSPAGGDKAHLRERMASERAVGNQGSATAGHGARPRLAP